MGKKSINELEADLIRLREKEKEVKQEMELLKRSTDEKELRKRKGKMFALAEVVIDCLGENILEQQAEFEIFLCECKNEWFLERGYRGEASCKNI